MRIHACVALCWMVLPLMACHEKQPVTQKPSVGEASALAQPADPVGAPVVTLLGAGVEPRRTMRFSAKEGAKQRVAMQMKMKMDLTFAGSSHPTDMPTITMVTDVTTSQVAANGDITFRFVASDIEIADDGATPGINEVLREMMSSLKGMTGTMTITDRGFNKGTELELPPGASPKVVQLMGQMKDSMNQMSVVLPREPMGVGGKWRVDSIITSQSLKLRQRATYEVVKLESGQLTATCSIEQSADPQPMISPEMPSLKMKLVRMNGGGGGETTIDLTKAMPVKAHVRMRSKLEMVIDPGGKQEQPMAMEMTLGMMID